MVSNVSEDDDSDGGFRQHSVKPYSRIHVSEQQRYNHFSRGIRDNSYVTNNNNAQQDNSVGISKVRLKQSLSSGYQDMAKSTIRPKIYHHFDASKVRSKQSKKSTFYVILTIFLLRINYC
jgi:hypothetical protein